jgi:hypothetical protein
MYKELYEIPDESGDGPRDESRGRAAARGVFWGSFAAVVILALVLVLAIAFGSDRFVSFGVSSDITEFLQLVKESDLDGESKQSILDRLGALRESARRGKHVGFWVWLDYDESIRSLIEDGDITKADLVSLARELDSIESQLGPRAAPADRTDAARPAGGNEAGEGE